MNTRSCNRLSWLALCGVGACQSAVAPAVKPPAPIENSALAVAPVQTSTRAAGVKPAQTIESEPTQVAGAHEPAEPSPFVQHVRLPNFAQLQVTGERALLAIGGVPLPIAGDEVVIDPKLLDGVPGVGDNSTRLYGAHPESLWALVSDYEERTSTAALWHWSGAEWTASNDVVDGRFIIGITHWTAGRSIALVTDGYRNRFQFRVLEAPRATAVPTFGKARWSNDGCVDGIAPAALAGLPSGELFLAGTACEVDSADEVVIRGAAVQRWAAGQTQGKLELLPGLTPAETDWSMLNSLVAHSGQDAWVAGSFNQRQSGTSQAYLAHFDGERWQRQPAPPSESIEELHVAPNGTLWAFSSGHLWRQEAGAGDQWQPVALPALPVGDVEMRFSSLWVRSAQEVWATVDTGELSYLVRTQTQAPIQLPAEAQLDTLLTALSPYCSDSPRPTLVLLKLGRNAPANADVPRVRAVLRSDDESAAKVQLVEVPFLGRRYIALRGDAEALDEFSSKLYLAQIPGVEPQRRCIDAEATRTLSLDGKSGAGTARR